MVGVMNDSLALISRLSAGKMAANALCNSFAKAGISRSKRHSVVVLSYFRLWYVIKNPRKISQFYA